MTTTFAMIDNCSGDLWGVIEGNDPLNACRRLDESIRAYGRCYTRERIAGTSATGYHVYDVTGIMTADGPYDGQLAEDIALAESGRLIAQVACYDDDT